MVAISFGHYLFRGMCRAIETHYDCRSSGRNFGKMYFISAFTRRKTKSHTKKPNREQKKANRAQKNYDKISADIWMIRFKNPIINCRTVSCFMRCTNVKSQTPSIANRFGRVSTWQFLRFRGMIFASYQLNIHFSHFSHNVIFILCHSFCVIRSVHLFRSANIDVCRIF